MLMTENHHRRFIEKEILLICIGIKYQILNLIYKLPTLFWLKFSGQIPFFWREEVWNIQEQPPNHLEEQNKNDMHLPAEKKSSLSNHCNSPKIVIEDN